MKKNSRTVKEYACWHYLFGNQTPLEVFDLLLSKRFQLPPEDTMAWQAWMVLFNSMGPREAAGVVMRDWIPDHHPEKEA